MKEENLFVSANISIMHLERHVWCAGREENMDYVYIVCSSH